MFEIINTERIPIYLWTDSIESSAMSQIKNISNLPFAFHHVAIMPDCHTGYGMPIGGVLACEEYIVPNAVGVDIGCGMIAIPTSLKRIDIEALEQIHSDISRVIPVGFEHHKSAQDKNLMPDRKESMEVINQEFENALFQIGTLGGGNHFIEIQSGSDGYIWVMVHSGSRNIGYKVADYYNRKAKNLNKKWDSSIPKSHQLAYLPFDSKEGQEYYNEMQFCVAFALENRMHIARKTLEILNDHVKAFDIGEVINIAHNYANVEMHFGKEVIVHRKGATSATKNEVGIIPGSQGTKSYIVKGKGEPNSFNSCSHGAGRVLGRKEAKRVLNLRKEIETLDAANVIHDMKSIRDLDEASSAYKNIEEVMRNQSDLVDIVVEMTPLAVVKG